MKKNIYIIDEEILEKNLKTQKIYRIASTASKIIQTGGLIALTTGLLSASAKIGVIGASIALCGTISNIIFTKKEDKITDQFLKIQQDDEEKEI